MHAIFLSDVSANKFLASAKKIMYNGYRKGDNVRIFWRRTPPCKTRSFRVIPGIRFWARRRIQKWRERTEYIVVLGLLDR